MMNLVDRISSFKILGNLLRSYPEAPEGLSEESRIISSAAAKAEEDNPWFTQAQITRALHSIGHSLAGEAIEKWLEPYLGRIGPKGGQYTTGVVMAGNIPAVGFHDLLCVLISGNRLTAKLSAQDRHLIPAIAEILIRIDGAWKDIITWSEGQPGKFDRLIATGSNNSRRYFEYYFSKYPRVIRGNRNGVAILNGEERESDLKGLADDILSFFGLGCRNVSKILVPGNYDFTGLIKALSSFSEYMEHTKYRNNYDYRKTMLLLGNSGMIDTGNILLVRSQQVPSPVAMLNYDYYSDLQKVEQICMVEKESVQCIVSNIPLPFKTVRPGSAQQPELWDYADNVDTMEFLTATF